MASGNQQKTLLEEVQELVGQVKNAILKSMNFTGSPSLTDVAKFARVEPLAVVSKDCINLEYLPDVMQSLLNLFMGYYMQSIAIVGGTANSYKVMKILDSLNPDRDFNNLLISSESIEDRRYIGAENFKYRLPTSVGYALEDDTKASPKPDGAAVDYNSSANAGKVLTELANLAVGKMIVVELTIEGKTVKVPVTVRLMPSLISNASVEHILALKSEDEGLVERFHQWRAGRITFIRDLIFCQDMIDAHKKAIRDDKEGVYSEIMRRVANSKSMGLLTNTVSMATASNLFIISEEVAKETEIKLGGKLSNPKIRDKAFENTYAMIIAVVDREWERVTFYHRDIAEGTNVSIKEIKAANKTKGGPDILDIYRMLSQGNAPSF